MGPNSERAEMMIAAIGTALDQSDLIGAPSIIDVGEGDLPSVFDVSGLAVASIGAVCSELTAVRGQNHAVEIDRFLAGQWFTFFNAPIGWAFPPVWDDLAGVYATKDGFIRLHTNAPHHKAALISVLKCDADRSVVARLVESRAGDALETAITEAGGCAAKLRSRDAWQAHAQGLALQSEPLISWAEIETFKPQPKPLSDIKILDLTRVLAGPVATRTLAGFGADVLRIDPPNWSEPICEPEVTWGKRLATLDLKCATGREAFLTLLRDADILVHGLRADALDALGIGQGVRRKVNPSLIDIAHNAYGWSGPWAKRRGFDSLVQMSCGIAHAGMVAKEAEGPVPLPVQALDYGTGYLIAAAALRALRIRNETGRIMQARLSLARTAALLMKSDGPGVSAPALVREEKHFQSEPKDTAWGPVRSLKWPGPEAPKWSLPARPFHSDAPAWR